MATSEIQWPIPTLPESTKALVTKFYEVADSRAEDAPRRLGTEVFAPTGEIFVNRRKIIGTEGECERVILPSLKRRECIPIVIAFSFSVRLGGLMLSISRHLDIVAAQESLWGAVKSRVHHIHKVYNASPAGDDLMVLGIVEWTFNDGDGKVLDGYFTSRLVIDNTQSDEPRIKLFQGWAVSTNTPMTTA